MAIYFPQYSYYYPLQENYTYQVPMTNWTPMPNTAQTQGPVYVPSVVPFIFTTPQVMTKICPYTGTLFTEPVLPSMILNSRVTKIVSSCCNNPNGCCLPETLVVLPTIQESYTESESLRDRTANEEYADVELEQIDHYMNLPKELFPPAKEIEIDPNSLIDEFCKLENIQENESWILDLEFGIPENRPARALPVYNVQNNSVHCRDNPNELHPGFDSCNLEFKKEFLSYYDRIMSAWYEGYSVLNPNRSINNFQHWLSVPMEALGMNWR